MSSDEDFVRAFFQAQQQRQKSDADRVKELLGEDTVVFHNNKPAYALNSSLVLKQQLDVSELRALKSLHAEKLKYFDLMEQTDDPEKLKAYANEVKFIEFEMQKNWHFPQDESFHDWYRVPKCTCPKLDNQDRKGSRFKVIDPQCPIHGDGLAF